MGQFSLSPQLRFGFASQVAIAFALFLALGLTHHELWRDEFQIWMLVRDSASISELFQHLRYETGHPFLWYLLLYPLSRFTRSPIALQSLHWAIATLTIYLFSRCAPFTPRQKILFAFGYFPLYEYGVISRNYGLGVLLLFSACALVPHRQRRYWPIALTLGLAANTNFYALVCAAALGTTLCLEAILARLNATPLALRWWDVGLSSGLWLGGLGLYFQQLPPPPDGGISTTTVTNQFDLEHLVSTIALLWKSYAPLPWFSLHFWNTNFVSEGDAALLSLVLALGAIALLWQQPLTLWLYGSGTLAILGVAYFKHGGGVRHWGYAFILLIMALWLRSVFPVSPCPPARSPFARLGQFLNQRQCQFFTGLLILQLLAGITAYSLDWQHPFSQAQTAAHLLQQRSLAALPLAGDRDWAALTLAGYLDRPVYYPASDRIGTYLIWNNQRADQPFPVILPRLNRWLQAQTSPAILVFNYPLPPLAIAQLNGTVEALGAREGAIVADENFYLYQVTSVSR